MPRDSHSQPPIQRQTRLGLGFVTALCLSVLAIVPGLTVRGRADDVSSDSAQNARLTEMRSIAGDLTVQSIASGARSKVQRIAAPLYRFDDSARGFADGTVWAWGPTGR